MKNKKIILTIIIILVVIISFIGYKFIKDKEHILPNNNIDNNTPKPVIKRIKSKVDFNNNGIDDYSDFVIGARKQTELNPRYDGSIIYHGGYPPDGEGVCTDLIWKAFKEAGYSLKDMVDYDIKNNNEFYPSTHRFGPEPNIDFRRVQNLEVFFDRFAKQLTLDPYKVEEWQPGDIVIFGDQGHIAMISDKRNNEGIPWILHTSDEITGEEEGLIRRHTDENGPITRHYRFEYDPNELKLFEWVD